MQIDNAILQYNNKNIPHKILQQAESTNIPVVKHAGKIDKTSPLYVQSQELESIFVKMMLKAMRSTVDKSDSIISGGWAENIYQDMLDDEYAKSMAKNAGFGLAEKIYSQLVGKTKLS